MIQGTCDGSIVPCGVMQALWANGLESFYWSSDTSSQAEVEFVLQNRQGQLVPVEVKVLSKLAN